MEDESGVIIRPGAGPRRTNILDGRTTKRRGELAELAFMYKAASLGFGVAKPYGDSDHYDFILDSGKRLWRAQVKSTQSMHSQGYTLGVMRALASGKVAYDPSEIDVLIGHVVPVDTWYVLPVEVVAGVRQLRLYPAGCTREGCGRFEGFREAWCQMACIRDGPFANIAAQRRCQSEGRCPLRR